MERYEAYKDSGVEWIGEIPATWQMPRIEQRFAEERRTNVGLESFHALKFSAGSIVPKPEKWDEDEIADTYARYRCVSPGAIVINNLNLNFDLKSLRVGLVEEEGIITSAYIAIVPGAEIEPRFANYVLKSWDYKKAFHNMGKGLRLTLDWHELSKYRIQTPSRIEQQAIADYLDAKTTEIDALVADCEREVELLQEYRKAVISEAVTKGLDPDVPMKDSGIEWICKIPDGWGVIPLRRCIVGTGNGITRRGDYAEDGALVLKLRNINNGVIDYGFQNRMQLSEQELGSFKLDVGDFLFVRVNGSRDLVGKSAIFEGYHGNVAYNDHIIRISFSSYYCNPRFMLWYLQSEASRREIDLRVKTSAGQFTVSSDDIKECLFVMPPLQEQLEIASYLDAKTAEIDSFIESKQAMAEKLREYRKSLISEAVTGKFKVPGVN